MKILFLTDNFPPEVNAPATRTYEHCREWVKLGAKVTVITCFPNFPQGKVYPGYKNRLKRTEIIEGIKVIRVWTYITANEGFIKRTIDYISFGVSSFFAGLLTQADILVATSPQFFTALSAKSLAFWKRKPWIMEVRDMWPDSIKAVGAMKDSIFIRYFERKELQCYRSAASIVTVTKSFKQAITEKGINSEKIAVIYNGFDSESLNKDLLGEKELDSDAIEINVRQELSLDDDTVLLGYIGTHGMAHKLDFLLDCAKELADKKYHFLFIGDGAEKKRLLQRIQDEQLPNVTMLSSMPRDQVFSYIAALDVAVIHLRKNPLFRTVIPSKIFENAAMQVPMLLGVDGEARNLLETYDAGLYFEPENFDDFISKLQKITESSIYQQCRIGCKHLAEDFDRAKLAKNMYEHIENTLKLSKNQEKTIKNRK